MTNENPGVKVCTLYQKESKAGNMYFFGRSGSITYTLLQDKKATAEGKDPVWSLVVNEAPEWTGEKPPVLTLPKKLDEKPVLKKPSDFYNA